MFRRPLKAGIGVRFVRKYKHFELTSPSEPAVIPMVSDIRYALRSLRRWRLSAAVAVATLTVAIGTATSLYEFLRATLTSQTPRIEEIEAVGRVYASNRSLGLERSAVSLLDFESGVANASSFETVAAYRVDEREIVVGTASATVSVGRVSELFFEVFRVRPASGRLITADDLRRGDPVIVVSDSFWRRHFGGRTPGEATLTMGGMTWTVVGVLPESFGSSFLGIEAEAWTSMPRAAEPTSRSVSVIARLRGDTSWGAAQAELDALARTRFADGQWTWRAIPVRQDLQQRVTGASAFLLGPALIVLLIGCVNISCMLLGRGIERDVELSVRTALGASRARILRQLMTEHVLLAGVGGLLGCGLAVGILRVISARLAAFPAAPDLVLDTSILAAACGVSLIAAILFGTLPAVRVSRRDVATALKGGTAPPSARFVGYHTRDLVVFVELALAVVLIVVAAMWLNLFAELQRIAPTFPADQVVVAHTEINQIIPAVDAISGIPGVTGVTAVSGLPGSRSSAVQLRANNGRSARAAQVVAQPSFFTTVGLPIVRGRTFDPLEVHANSGTVIVSETLAAALWPNEEPLGAVVNVTSRVGDATAVVVGVCADALKLGRLAQFGIVFPDVYVPHDPESGSQLVILARTNKSARSLVRPIENVLSRVDGAMNHVSVLADERQFVQDQSWFLVRMIGAFGLLALFLAATGVFAVLTQSVSQRTTEFGVRMAMGASPGAVLLMVAMREAKLIVAAIAAGAIGTVLVTRGLFAELVMINATEVRLWITVALLCGGFAAGAVVLATHRIVRLDPWTVLRNG